MHAGYGSPGQPGYGPRPQPLGGLAIAAQILLAANVFADIYLFVAMVHHKGVVSDAIDRPGSVTIDTARSADDAVHTAAWVTLVALIVCAVVFIIWFYRARTNAGIYSPHTHSRSRGWAIGGWFCPIVNYWFPYQIARDIYDASSRADGEQYAVRSYPILPIWWICYAFAGLAYLPTIGVDTDTLSGLRTRDEWGAVSAAARVIAGILAILVVRKLTASDTKKQATFVGPMPVYAPYPTQGYAPPPPFQAPPFQAPPPFQPPSPDEPYTGPPVDPYRQPPPD